MCLLPFGGGGNVLLPPSVPARKLGDYLRVGIVLHFLLAIFIMIAGGYVQGVFQVLGALVGFMSIKNPEGYNFQCVLSYCVYTGMSAFWSLLQIILFFSGATTTESDGSTYGWRYYAAVSMIVVSPFIYIYCAVTSYYLYKELRRVLDEATGQLGEEEAPSYGQSIYGPSASSSSSSSSTWQHQESHPTAPAGFKAFSGQGNRLGGN